MSVPEPGKYVASFTTECYERFSNPLKGSSLTLQKQKLLAFLKGGALKPSDVEKLWVHVTCAWYQPEVAFQVMRRWSLLGILKIPSNSFV
ncbi:hypothetical protein IFM89_024426 [Coptis chinensis]|uniref:PHD-type domain-containing protein n=1 Tax=Coptis chinensis TaxID=261450 RepID=A0A835HRS1_9MAGN|nr:hypothetical protein IFM89_024426 [Coptis chinensis]